ncbi:MAG: hypothetical protein WC536_02395 [Patescibacteria group bacterium]
MGIENGFSQINEVLSAKEQEIEEMNGKLDKMPNEERSKKVREVKDHLESLGIDTTNMDQRDLINRFVSKETEGILNNR